MTSDIHIWLERLSALHKSQLRKAATMEGMPLVHVEILYYLSICNKYSNTAQAVVEYLGQTKGSISQSLKVLEDKGHIERGPDKDDKRVTRLSLSKEGLNCLKNIKKNLRQGIPNDPGNIDSLKSILSSWQNQNDLQGFGQCKSCQYKRDKGANKFQCGLTEETLTDADTKQICREHRF